MNFAERLELETQQEQRDLMSIPVLQAAATGNITRETYLAYLEQAYHHVKHTVPLLMACGARLGHRRQELQRAVAEYIDEESGHEQWILDDIAATGGDAAAVQAGQPGRACELMIAYLHDRVARHNPMSLFGMVHVLEGTSVKAATQAARAIGENLGLGEDSFHYLRSHGTLDIEHLGFFRRLMAQVEDPDDQDAVLHTSRMVFHLYGNIFRDLEWQPLESVAV